MKRILLPMLTAGFLLGLAVYGPSATARTRESKSIAGEGSSNALVEPAESRAVAEIVKARGKISRDETSPLLPVISVSLAGDPCDSGTGATDADLKYLDRLTQLASWISAIRGSPTPDCGTSRG